MDGEYMSKEKNNTLTLNDLLAIERTKLANERTFLAYIRTSLSMIGGGITLIQFFENQLFVVTGYVLLPIGVLLLFYGIHRHRQSHEKIKEYTVERKENKVGQNNNDNNNKFINEQNRGQSM